MLSFQQPACRQRTVHFMDSNITQRLFSRMIIIMIVSSGIMIYRLLKWQSDQPMNDIIACVISVVLLYVIWWHLFMCRLWHVIMCHTTLWMMLVHSAVLRNALVDAGLACYGIQFSSPSCDVVETRSGLLLPHRHRYYGPQLCAPGSLLSLLLLLLLLLLVVVVWVSLLLYYE